jgi:hypothetical protein
VEGIPFASLGPDATNREEESQAVMMKSDADAYPLGQKQDRNVGGVDSSVPTDGSGVER